MDVVAIGSVMVLDPARVRLKEAEGKLTSSLRVELAGGQTPSLRGVLSRTSLCHLLCCSAWSEQIRKEDGNGRRVCFSMVSRILRGQCPSRPASEGWRVVYVVVALSQNRCPTKCDNHKSKIRTCGFNSLLVEIIGRKLPLLLPVGATKYRTACQQHAKTAC